MTKFRTRMLVTLITFIIAVFVGLGFLLGQLFKDYYHQSFNERLSKECNLISSYIEDNGGVNAFGHIDVFKISNILNVRATITNASGEIMSDSGGVVNTTGLKKIIDKVISKNPPEKDMLEEGNEFDLHYYWKPLFKGGQTEGYLFLSTKSSELQRAYNQIWWILALCFGIALMLIVLLGIQITLRYTRPIESAANVAIELAKGNYRARAKVNRLDETEILGTSINLLAHNLQELVTSQEMQKDRLSALIENMDAGLILIDSRGYINLLNKGYAEHFQINPSDYLNKLYYEVIQFEDICHLIAEVFRTERKVSKQLLLPFTIERKYFMAYGVPIFGANNAWKGVLLVLHDITEMKKLEQMRKDFVANVSHELKTPITSIKGFTETLLDGAMNDKATLESFLSIISKESNRLQSLIADLLELSRIEQHEFQLTLQELDVHQLLKEVIVVLSGKAAKKEIQLVLHSSQEQVMMNGDQNRLKQIFINLIVNAITYAPVKSDVKIDIFDQDDKVKISIADSGIGLEKEEIPRIFERFYRVDKARSRNSGGTGLGLAIVKHLVEAHHGNISVNSNIGKGSEFIIELPK